jgi:hypothetical protein
MEQPLPTKIPLPCKHVYDNFQKCLEKSSPIRYGCKSSTSCSFHAALYQICVRTAKYGTFY